MHDHCSFFMFPGEGRREGIRSRAQQIRASCADFSFLLSKAAASNPGSNVISRSPKGRKHIRVTLDDCAGCQTRKIFSDSIALQLLASDIIGVVDAGEQGQFLGF